MNVRHLVPLVGSLALLATGSASARGTGDPPADRTLGDSTLSACGEAPGGSACLSATLAAIDAARAAEGVVPMVLPLGYGALSAAEQLLVLANLERLDRGIGTPVLGLAGPLDGNAARAAAADEDPLPDPFLGDFATSNWAGGFASVLEADFSWMYDDGPGSGNLDCTAPGQAGCWGHRNDILSDSARDGRGLSAPLMMGAAQGRGAYGTSWAEVFVGGDGRTAAGQPDAPLSPDWSSLALKIPPGFSPGQLQLPAAPAAATLRVWASGRPQHVTASLASPGAGWSVKPSSCTLAPGQSCSLTVSARGGALDTALHLLAGAIVQSVPLSLAGASPATAPPPSSGVPAAGSTGSPAGAAAHRPSCLVPRMRGLSLIRAERALQAARCRSWRVIRFAQASGRHHHPRQVVVAQAPRGGSGPTAGDGVLLRVG
jgi:hypothetical protein